MLDYILEISFDAGDAAREELVQSALFLTSSRGSTSRDTGGTTVISAYFDSASARDDARSVLAPLEIELQAIDRERVDWLEHYEQSLRPIDIGERFVVAPDASLIPAQSQRMPIVVPQEQAFGTGSHETTALCMTLLETLEVRGRRGLDIGAGSGILALAMHLLGAEKVIAFDNDLDAFGALRDNRIRNGISESAMPVFIGGVDALRGGAFDVVTMNIIPEVIIPLLGDVVARMSEAGHLIVSGVLTERRSDVVSAAEERSLRLVAHEKRGEWWAGVFQRLR